MFISIQQPEYFPWLGFFDKARQVDHVVFLDNVQFKKRYFENRNRIRTATGWSWIRTPVRVKGRFGQNICDVEIDDSQPWRRKLVTAIRQNYSKAPYWHPHGEPLCALVEDGVDERLADFNLAIIRFLLDAFELTPEITIASSLGIRSRGADQILDICESMDADGYLSGRDGRNYLDEDAFEEAGIALRYQDFEHPAYTQYQGGGFVPQLSAIDLLFNMGPTSTEILGCARNLYNGSRRRVA